jgi:outer membrane protein OmpA-like peptidoglycan-associated protein
MVNDSTAMQLKATKRDRIQLHHRGGGFCAGTLCALWISTFGAAACEREAIERAAAQEAKAASSFEIAQVPPLERMPPQFPVLRSLTVPDLVRTTALQFSETSAALDRSALESLGALVAELRGYPFDSVRVLASYDRMEVDDPAAGAKLAQARAAAAIDVLRVIGWEQKKFQVVVAPIEVIQMTDRPIDRATLRTVRFQIPTYRY